MKKRIDNHLAEGEVTGHYHEAVGENVTVYGKGDFRKLNAPKGAKITHQEHNTIEVDPGTYLKEPVQEYNYDKRQAEAVRD